MKLFVGNIPFEVTEAQLRQHFDQVGSVTKVSLVYDKETQKPRGFGFVEMPNEEQAKYAMEHLGGQELFGRRLDVQPAKERPPQDRGNRGARP